MQTLPAVPPIIPNPEFDDEVVQIIQLRFADRLDWLDKAYHIARVGIEAKTLLKYPQIQANNATNEVYDIRPDNKCPAYCFFEVEKPYEIDYYNQTAKYYLSVTFWGFLTLIDPNTTTDFTGTLIRQAVAVLERCHAGDITVEENPEAIFNNFTALKQDKNQYLLRKYTAFKIRFTRITSATKVC